MQLKNLIRMSVLVATAMILYRFGVSLPFMPPFLKYDPSEVPIVVGALAFGPGVGVALELVKNLLELLIQGGANPVGLVANFVAGCSLILGIAPVYRVAGRSVWRWLAVAAGACLMAAVMIPLNLYFFLPAHGMTVSNASTMAVQLLTPFNLVKGVLNAGLGLIMFERLAFVLRAPATERSIRPDR